MINIPGYTLFVPAPRNPLRYIGFYCGKNVQMNESFRKTLDMEFINFVVSDDKKSFYICKSDNVNSVKLGKHGKICSSAFYEFMINSEIEVPCKYTTVFDKALNLWKFEYSGKSKAAKLDVKSIPNKPRKRITKEMVF